MNLRRFPAALGAVIITPGAAMREVEARESGGFWMLVAWSLVAAVTLRFANLADAQLEENAPEPAKAGEGRLEKVEADERREEQPELIHPISKGEPGEHKRAGDEVDDALYFRSGDVRGSDLAGGDNVEAGFAGMPA